MYSIQLKRITQWLNKPFPFYENYTQKVLIPIVFTMLVMFGIVILNYSGNPNTLFTQIFETTNYGIIIIVISLFLSVVLPAIFPKIFDNETWTVKKTILYFFVSIIIIGLFISLYAYQYKNSNHLSFISFFYFILKRSVILSFFPILSMVFYAERKLYKRNHLQALELIDKLKEQRGKKNENDINSRIILAKETQDELSINDKNLLYIKAEGNYCQIVYEEKKEVKHKLIRTSLKSIENTINKPEVFIRCHKSYLVNSNKIIHVTGNAKGYLFSLKGYQQKIPVSRNFSKLILQKIKIHTQ